MSLFFSFYLTVLKIPIAFAEPAVISGAGDSGVAWPSAKINECQNKTEHFFQLYSRFSGHHSFAYFGFQKDNQKKIADEWRSKAWIFYADEILPMHQENIDESWRIFEKCLKKYNEKKKNQVQPEYSLLRTTSPFGYVDGDLITGKKYGTLGFIPWTGDLAIRSKLQQTLVRGGILDESDLYGIAGVLAGHASIRYRLEESIILKNILLPLFQSKTHKRERASWRLLAKNEVFPDHFSFEALTLAHQAAEYTAEIFGQDVVFGKNADVARASEVEALADEELKKHPESEWYPKLDRGVELAKKFVQGRLAQANAREALGELLCAPQAKLDETKAKAALDNWILFRAEKAPVLDSGDLLTLATAIMNHAAYRERGFDPGPLQKMLAAQWQAAWEAQGVKVLAPTPKDLAADAPHWLLSAVEAYQAIPSPSPIRNPTQILVEKVCLMQGLRFDIPRIWAELHKTVVPTGAPVPNKTK